MEYFRHDPLRTYFGEIGLGQFVLIQKNAVSPRR
jgi:hypothetical protein